MNKVGRRRMRYAKHVQKATLTDRYDMENSPVYIPTISGLISTGLKSCIDRHIDTHIYYHQKPF